ncbi:hypothetical protein L204_105499 [Cryptococcus depauperatus]|nr:hypothetical protein L204_02732 [Cryptococcus depauperatus CBS 7855]
MILQNNGTIVDSTTPDSDSTQTDPERCRLLGPTGLVVQTLMGVLVISSLVIKKQLEKRKRSWHIWFMDVGKQLVGQAVVHGLNVLISDLVASAANNNPCSLYFLNVLIDTTIGVGIIYFSLKFFTWYFSKHLGYDGFISGKYGHPPQPLFWWKQLVTYLLSIITMKLLVILPLTLPYISDALLQLGHSLLEYLSPSAQIIFVMAFFPLIMNVVQFCLVDQVIKASKADEDETRDDGQGYNRVPDWEGDEESQAAHGPVLDARQVKVETTLPPSSPLLSSSNHQGYGSTTPSPIGSPTRGVNNESVWQEMISKTSPTARSEIHATVSSSKDSWDSNPDGRRNLDHPFERGERSNAPSPDLLPHPANPCDLSNTLEASAASLEDASQPTQAPVYEKEWGTSSTVSQKRRITSDIEREARLTLSPPESPIIRERERSEDSRDEMGLDVWQRARL